MPQWAAMPRFIAWALFQNAFWKKRWKRGGCKTLTKLGKSTLIEIRTLILDEEKLWRHMREYYIERLLWIKTHWRRILDCNAVIYESPATKYSKLINQRREKEIRASSDHNFRLT